MDLKSIYYGLQIVKFVVSFSDSAQNAIDASILRYTSTFIAEPALLN